MKTIVCFGDSNTYGFNPLNGLRYEKNVRWPGVLQNYLGEDYYVVEEGCNGRTTIFLDSKEPWKCGESYLRACLNSHKPIDLLIIMLGSNDMKRMYHADSKEIAAGAGQLVTISQEFLREKQNFCPKIILVAPPEIGKGISHGPFGKSFDESAVSLSKQLPVEYQIIAKKNGCDFFDASKVADPSEEDHLHLMPDAHQRLAEALAKHIKAYYG